MPYRWDDGYGARLGVMRRDDPYGPIRWFEIDPCYVFHVANAYDSVTRSGANSIVLQAARYQELWRNNSGFEDDATMWTWTIDLENGTVSEQQLDDRAVEFPRIDDRLATLAAQYAVSVGKDKLVRHDLNTGAAVEHLFGTAANPGVPGEAVFVPSTGPADESAGYYLTYVYDAARNGSDLVILDASDFAADPVATVKMPHRVPFGFHGNWIGSSA